MKTHLQCQLGGNTLQGWGKVLQKNEYAVNHCPIYSAISPIIHRSRGQGVKIGVTLLLLQTHQQNVCFATLCSAGLELLLPEGGMLPRGDSKLEVKTHPTALGPHASESIGKKGNYGAGLVD